MGKHERWIETAGGKLRGRPDSLIRIAGNSVPGTQYSVLLQFRRGRDFGFVNGLYSALEPRPQVSAFTRRERKRLATAAFGQLLPDRPDLVGGRSGGGQLGLARIQLAGLLESGHI